MLALVLGLETHGCWVNFLFMFLVRIACVNRYFHELLMDFSFQVVSIHPHDNQMQLILSYI